MQFAKLIGIFKLSFIFPLPSQFVQPWLRTGILVVNYLFNDKNGTVVGGWKTRQKHVQSSFVPFSINCTIRL